LHQHLFDCELGDVDRAFEIGGNEPFKVIGWGLVKYIPALFTTASIELNVLIAVSATLATVVASLISPSTKASRRDEGSSFDVVTLSEVATTL
jgi:hypothetical protein